MMIERRIINQKQHFNQKCFVLKERIKSKKLNKKGNNLGKNMISDCGYWVKNIKICKSITIKVLVLN